MKPQTLIFLIAFLLIVFSSGAGACLTPTMDIKAHIVSLGLNGGNLEQVQVSVYGFELAEYPAGCTFGLSTESQILPAPAWATQRRVIAKGMSILDAETGDVYTDFFLNVAATLDFNAETMGLGYFTWPMPVWFTPFTTFENDALNGSLPQGEVVLVFDLLIKPQYAVNNFVNDLTTHGHVASDFSYTDPASGITYLYWSSFPMLNPISQVTVQ